MDRIFSFIQPKTKTVFAGILIYLIIILILLKIIMIINRKDKRKGERTNTIK